MGKFIIEGGYKLSGEITPQGAKNEALEVISAVLLTADPVVISNVPEILDVKNLIGLLQGMGVKVQRLEKGTYRFQADEVDTAYIETEEFVKKCAALRGSVMVVGPLLSRFGHAWFAKPGGDKIGRRRVDTHLSGMVTLGAEMDYNADRRAFHLTSNGRLTGRYMLLDEASVTGTANIVMAAVLARGTTTIYNAACEPYLQQLCKMLNRMGAFIDGVGSNLLRIHGVEKLYGTNHRILPDMIEVGSFIGMAAICQSELTIKDVSWYDLGIIPDAFRRLGVNLEQRGDDIYVPAQESYEIDSFLDGSIMTLADAPWPGLTPDLLSVMLVVATQCKGSVLIHQKMFESRLFFVDKLIDMGAQIILCDPHRAVVIGHDHRITLKAARLVSPDIRAGIAMLLAAMSAKGTSTIDNIEQIDRGYEDIEPEGGPERHLLVRGRVSGGRDLPGGGPAAAAGPRTGQVRDQVAAIWGYPGCSGASGGDCRPLWRAGLEGADHDLVPAGHRRLHPHPLRPGRHHPHHRTYVSGRPAVVQGVSGRCESDMGPEGYCSGNRRFATPPTASGGPLPLMWPRVATGFRNNTLPV